MNEYSPSELLEKLVGAMEIALAQIKLAHKRLDDIERRLEMIELTEVKGNA